MEIIWEEAPVAARGRKPVYKEFFDALKENPGKTARAPEAMALSAQTSINSGRMAGPGFEARTSTVDAEGNALPDGQRRMWVTYTGAKRRGRKPKGSQ